MWVSYRRGCGAVWRGAAVFCSGCGCYLTYRATHCPQCGSGLSLQMGSPQGSSVPSPGSQPIILSSTAGNARMRHLAEAARQARGEAPTGFGPTAALTPKKHAVKFVMVVGLVTAIALVSVVWGPGLVRSA